MLAVVVSCDLCHSFHRRCILCLNCYASQFDSDSVGPSGLPLTEARNPTDLPPAAADAGGANADLRPTGFNANSGSSGSGTSAGRYELDPDGVYFGASPSAASSSAASASSSSAASGPNGVSSSGNGGNGGEPVVYSIAGESLPGRAGERAGHSLLLHCALDPSGSRTLCAPFLVFTILGLHGHVW